MKNIKLRISNCRDHAVEFAAQSPDSLRISMAKAWQEFREWESKSKKTSANALTLHVFNQYSTTGHDWSDAGYGHGTIVYCYDPVQNDRKNDYEFLWSRVTDAHNGTIEFARFMGLLPEQNGHGDIDKFFDDVNNDMAVAQRQEFKIISGCRRLSTTELAGKTGKSVGRIRQIAKRIPGAENESGRGWSFPVSAVGFVKSQPKPGPKKKTGQ